MSGELVANPFIETETNANEYISPIKESSSHQLNQILEKELMDDKLKPRNDLLVGLNEKENDPYSEFDFSSIEPAVRTIRSPSLGFNFFSSKPSPKTPTYRARSFGTPTTIARRNRLLQMYTPVTEMKANDNELSTIPPPTRRHRIYNTPASGTSGVFNFVSDDSTPRRILRPRKRPWIEEDDIPLSALREALIFQKLERTEQRTKTEGESGTKKVIRSGATPLRSVRVKSRLPQTNTKSRKRPAENITSTTPKARTARFLSRRKLFERDSEEEDETYSPTPSRRPRISSYTPRSKTQAVASISSNSKTTAKDTDSDDENLMSLKQRMKNSTAYKRKKILSDSDDEPLSDLKERLKSDQSNTSIISDINEESKDIFSDGRSSMASA